VRFPEQNKKQVFGILLAALAVQSMVDGLADLGIFITVVH
jgi:small neutral amino acid transporter SnatA (MarC family)